MRYAVYLNIRFRREIRDAEGDVIKNELFQRRGLDVDVRVGKCLMLLLEAGSEEEAKKRAEALAWELRLGNPNVHVVEVVKVCPESQC